MRAAVGDIVAAPGGRDYTAALHAECAGIAKACGFAPRAASMDWARAQLTAPRSTFTASMMRDVEAQARLEADHIIEDLIARGRAAAPGTPRPLLELVRTALKTYEVRRARERS